MDRAGKDLSGTGIKLPEPAYQGNLPVESALLARRSIRSFSESALDLFELSQLLWAAQGVTRPNGYRTSPSAGALYPLEIQVVAGSVVNLDPGVYRYRPEENMIMNISRGDVRKDLAEAALGQSMIARAPVIIAISAVYVRTTRKYSERGIRYVLMEAGHAAQNVHLQAVSLHLGTVVVGAFYDDKVKKVLSLEENENPLLLMPVGR